MLRYYLFGSEHIPTRLEKCNELNIILTLITQLRSKELVLNKAMVAKGAASVDFLKHTVIAGLLESIDELINEFNHQPVIADQQAERRAMLELVTQISTRVTATIDRHRETINAARNRNQAIVASSAEYGMYAATIATLYMLPLSFIPKIFLFACTVGAKDDAINYAGLRRHITHTTKLLTALNIELNNARENLRQALDPDYLAAPAQGNNNIGNNAALLAYSLPMQAYINSFNNKESIAVLLDGLNLTEAEEERLEPFCDPVLFTVMNRPVLLEGQAYDLDALLTLQMNADGMRRNPFTNVDFYLRDLQPNRDVYNRILAEIDAIRRDRQVVPSAPPAPYA
jgi:hypothetical protein